ncbi:MAG: hypothetical protein L0Y71_20570 [Gemmataceae bacterium]|nr:hypothetical protein [Gemmataceae bacterium]
MLAWFVDNANIVYIVLGMIVLALGVSWWQNRRVRTLAIIAVVVALGALFWLLTQWIPTDRKQLQANLWAMGTAVLDRKPSDLAKRLSNDFRFQNLSRDEIAQAVTAAAGQFSVDSINLWEFDVKSVTADKAEIWFRCVANSAGGRSFLALCKAHFVKDGDQWLMQDVAFYQPIANTDQKIQLPIGR